MKKTYYNVDRLRQTLVELEERHEKSSGDFYDAYVDYDESRMEGVSGFHRHAWASFYRDWRRMSRL